jgi:hypothetical protein
MIVDLKQCQLHRQDGLRRGFGISQNYRRRHLDIVGQTGADKSTTLSHFAEPGPRHGATALIDGSAL